MTAFLFTDVQSAFAESVRGFAQPMAREYLSLAASEAFPWDLNRRLAQQHLLALTTPEAFGGQGTGHTGADRIFVGIAAEELSAANFYLGMLLFAANMAADILHRHLSRGVARRWLEPVMAGESVLSLAITEPACGSDAAAMVTRATRRSGGWVLNGEKTSITYAPHAAGFMVFAKTAPDRRARGVTAFLVDRESPGVSMQRFNDAGWKPLGRGAIAFQDVFVADDHVIGEVNTGFQIVMRGFDYARCVIGLISLGVARTVLQMTIDHAREREAFGRKIADFQGVAFPIAEHATRLEAARWLCYRALALADGGRPHTREAAMIKWWVPRIAIDALRDCIVVNGHGAYTEELPFQALLRDLSGFELGDGTAQIQKLVIARELFGRGVSPS